MQTAIATAVSRAANINASGRAGKYLSFTLGAEEYAIRVKTVREIVKVQHITAVPETPKEIKGVINLRGKVIPIVDLGVKFGLPEKEYGARTCIIVIEIDDSTSGLMGVIVDEVSEVLTLQDGDIQETPSFGRGVQTHYLIGMAKVKDKVKILLDIERALSAEDLLALQEVLTH